MKSKTKSEPWAPAQPYILQGLENTQDVFDKQQPRLDAMGDTAYNMYQTVAPNVLGPNPFVMGGQSAVSDLTGGRYLGANPYTDEIVGKNANDIRTSVGGLFSGRGMYGSTPHQGVLGKAIGDMANQVRYGDYNAERQRMTQGLGLIPAMRGAEFIGLPEAQGLLSSAAEIPWVGVNAYTGNIRNGSAGYGTQTTNSGIGGAIGMGLKAYDSIWGGK